MRRPLLCLLAWFLPAAARCQELRGFWVDAFHSGFKSYTEVSQLDADARAWAEREGVEIDDALLARCTAGGST
jgi:hypothetical protein